MKLVRFLLSLAFILLCGYSNLYASHMDGYTHMPPVREQLARNHLTTIHTKHHPTVKDHSAVREKNRSKINLTEDEDDDEDDEPSAPEKYHRNNTCLPSFFYTRTSGNLCYYLQKPKNRFLFSKHFSYCSSYRYILFQVIRI